MFVNGMTATESVGAAGVGADCVCGPAAIVDVGTNPVPAAAAGADRTNHTTRDKTGNRYLRMKGDSDER
jgi:hypothetical protein